MILNIVNELLLLLLLLTDSLSSLDSVIVL